MPGGLVVGAGVIRRGRAEIPLSLVRGVRIEYRPNRRANTIEAQIELLLPGDERPLFGRPLKVLTLHDFARHPGEIRWIAEMLVQAVSEDVGIDIPLHPPRSEGEPPIPPESDVLPEVVSGALTPALEASEGSLTLRSPRRQWGYLGLGIGAMVVTGVVYAFFSFIGVLIVSALGVPAELTLMAVLGLGVLLCLLVGAPPLYLAARSHTTTIDADGLTTTGLPALRRTWAGVGDLVIRGRVPGPVVISSARTGAVLASWRKAGWTVGARIADLRAVAARMAELGGVELVDELPDLSHWREYEQRKRDSMAHKGFYKSMLLDLLYAKFDAAPPLEPEGVKADHDGIQIPLRRVRWRRTDTGVERNRGGSIIVRADARGVGRGSNRLAWDQLTDVDVVYATTFYGERPLVEIAAKLVLVTAQRRIPIGPWIAVEVDGTPVCSAGELHWVANRLLELRDENRDREGQDQGSTDDVPDTLRQIAAQRREPER